MGLRQRALAGVATASLLTVIVAGTLAWTSLNSQKINEWFGSGAQNGGAGGTLHDDHSDNSPDKSIYVENWGTEDIFVRIRLDEYMEIGPGAGLKSEPAGAEIVHNPANLATPLVAGADIDRPGTWAPHVPGQSAGDCGGADANFHDFWEWHMGGQKDYYPAPAGSREKPDYVDVGGPDGPTGGGAARRTRPAQAMTMAQWKADGSLVGDYWVIDADGWAYWAAPLKHGDATGLLLEKVVLKKQPAGDYYYGINVKAQMATKEGSTENGALDNYKCFETDGGWTDDGRALLDKIVNGGNNLAHVDPVSYIADGATRISYSPPLYNGVSYVKQGGSFSAFGSVSVYDRMGFSGMDQLQSGDFYQAHDDYSRVSYAIKETARIGYRREISGALVMNCTGPDPKPGPLAYGPSIKMAFVVIPAECDGVVFGKSGKAYIDYGNNTYQELKEGEFSHLMALGPIIGIESIH